MVVVLGIYKIIKKKKRKKKKKKKKDLRIAMRRDWIVVGPNFEGEEGECDHKQLTGSRFSYPKKKKNLGAGFFFFIKKN